jgi:hypothetical protein
MNRFEYCHPDNNSDNDSFGFVLLCNQKVEKYFHL